MFLDVDLGIVLNDLNQPRDVCGDFCFLGLFSLKHHEKKWFFGT